MFDDDMFLYDDECTLTFLHWCGLLYSMLMNVVSLRAVMQVDQVSPICSVTFVSCIRVCKYVSSINKGRCRDGAGCL